MKLKKALKLINEICLAHTGVDGKCRSACPLFMFAGVPNICCLHKAGLKAPDFDELSKLVKSWASEQKQKRLGHIRAH